MAEFGDSAIAMDKFRDMTIGLCAECREPVVKQEPHKYEFRQHWVVVHFPKCPPVLKSVKVQ